MSRLIALLLLPAFTLPAQLAPGNWKTDLSKKSVQPAAK